MRCEFDVNRMAVVEEEGGGIGDDYWSGEKKESARDKREKKLIK